MRVGGFKDHYKTLQLGPGASLQQVKDHYYKLALQHHPDQGGNSSSMLQLNDAYATLSDPASRQTYDQSYRDYLLPVPNATPKPAVEVKPPPGPRRRAPKDINWKRAFWALAAVVLIGLVSLLERSPGSATPKPAAAHSANLTAVQQANANAAALLRQQYEACENSLTQQQNQVDSFSTAISAALAQGSTDQYNSLTANRTAAVYQFNDTAQRCRQLQSQYNAAADTYNRSIQ